MMTDIDRQIASIRGRQVALGPLVREHLPMFWQWFNDLEVMRTYNPRWSPMAWEKLEEWYGRVTGNKETFAFTIYELAEMRPVGFTTLLNVNCFHRVADFDILIGEKHFWRRGLGSEATCLTLDYRFTVLGLHNIMLSVYSFNAAGMRAYKTAGFREFGRRTQARHFGGHAYDLVYMECLATNFSSPTLNQLFPGTGDGDK